jgi:plasmid stabilization system protein ParE
MSSKSKPSAAELLIRDRFRLYELAALYHEDHERVEGLIQLMRDFPQMRRAIAAEAKQIRSQWNGFNHLNSALAVMRVLVNRVREDAAAIRDHLSDFEGEEVPEVLRNFMDGVCDRLGESPRSAEGCGEVAEVFRSFMHGISLRLEEGGKEGARHAA